MEGARGIGGFGSKCVFWGGVVKVSECVADGSGERANVELGPGGPLAPDGAEAWSADRYESRAVSVSGVRYHERKIQI